MLDMQFMEKEPWFELKTSSVLIYTHTHTYTLTHIQTHTHTLRLHGSVGKVTANYRRDRDTILVFRYFLLGLQAIPAVRIRILSLRLWHRVPLRHMAATKVSEPRFASMFGFGWRQFVSPKLPHYTTWRDTDDSTVHHSSLLHNFPVVSRISNVY